MWNILSAIGMTPLNFNGYRNVPPFFIGYRNGEGGLQPPLCWIDLTLIVTAKAMVNESMALFSQRSNSSNWNQEKQACKLGMSSDSLNAAKFDRSFITIGSNTSLLISKRSNRNRNRIQYDSL